MKEIFSSTFPIVIICIIVGVIIIGIVVAIINNVNSSTSDEQTLPVPPLDYMDTTTLNCPDYWKVIKNENDEITCQNNEGGYNNSIFKENDVGINFDVNKYTYPNNKKTQNILDNIDDKILVNSLDNCPNEDNNIINKTNNNINYTCPYDYPYPVKFNTIGLDDGEKKTINNYDSYVCSNRQTDQKQLTISKKEYNGYINNFVWCGTNTNKSKDGLLLDKLFDVCNNECNLSNLKCDKFWDTQKSYRQVCPTTHPIYKDVDGNDNCCDINDNCVDYSYLIDNKSDKYSSGRTNLNWGVGIKKSQNKTCPANFPYAVNLVKDDKTYYGVFCHVDSSNNVTSIPKNDSNFVGCNETNLNAIRNPQQLYFSCKSDNSCPIKYPFNTPTGKCCKNNPDLDIDNTCISDSYTTPCPAIILKNDNPYCKNNYETSCKNTMTFPKIKPKDWAKVYQETLDNNDITLLRKVPGMTERCNWVNTCGKVWQGISDFC